MGEYYLTTMAVSFLFSVSSYYGVSPWLSHNYSAGYRKLNKMQRIEWNTRTWSTIHCTVIGLLCLSELLFNGELWENPIWSESKAISYYGAATIGYMLADCIYVLEFPFNECFLYLLHHACVFFGIGYSLTYSVFAFCTGYRLIAELSNPCINVWWIMIAMGYPKDHKIVTALGVAMTTMFFLVRIAAMPIYYYTMYVWWGTEEFYRISYYGRIVWVLCSLLLDTMNTMWIIKLLRGALKQIRKVKADVKKPMIDRKAA